VDKLSKYDQQLFKSFSNKTMHLNGDEHINALLENNRNWVRSKNEEDPEFFQKLGDSLRHDEIYNSSLILCITSTTGKPQTPRFLYFGCADSRVPATEILGLG
jgi:carbonic anhydrase